MGLSLYNAGDFSSASSASSSMSRLRLTRIPASLMPDPEKVVLFTKVLEI